jgi:hypothetical protein
MELAVATRLNAPVTSLLLTESILATSKQLFGDLFQPRFTFLSLSPVVEAGPGSKRALAGAAHSLAIIKIPAKDVERVWAAMTLTTKLSDGRFVRFVVDRISSHLVSLTSGGRGNLLPTVPIPKLN